MRDDGPVLPNVVIAGVTKAGTTSLFRYLGQHPDIGVADVKEVDHYAPMVHGAEPPPLADYAAHFRNAAGKPWRLEASPRYFIGGPELVTRLDTELDGPRILIALRDPVARMWSSYTYKRSKAAIPASMSFAEFTAACREVVAGRLERRPESNAYRTLAVGAYATYLPDWFDRCGERVRIVFSEDLATRPAAVVGGICSWLGIDDRVAGGFDYAARNTTYVPRSHALRRVASWGNATLLKGSRSDSATAARLRSWYTKLNAAPVGERFSDADRRMVADFYAPSIVQLRELLTAHGCTQFPGWLAGDSGADQASNSSRTRRSITS